MPTIDRKTQPQRSCNQVMHMMNIAIVNERALDGDLEREEKWKNNDATFHNYLKCINWNPSRVRIFLTNITTSRHAYSYSIFVSTSNHRQQSESYLVINLIYSSTSCTDRIALAVITYQRKTIFSATATAHEEKSQRVGNIDCWVKKSSYTQDNIKTSERFFRRSSFACSPRIKAECGVKKLKINI